MTDADQFLSYLVSILTLIEQHIGEGKIKIDDGISCEALLHYGLNEHQF